MRHINLIAKTSIFLIVMICFHLSADNTKSATYISTYDAIDVCTRADMDWINFCNGLMQGYADVIYELDPSCIPDGTTRTQLSDIFTGPAVYNTESYKYNKSAFSAALEVFMYTFDCSLY